MRYVLHETYSARVSEYECKAPMKKEYARIVLRNSRALDRAACQVHQLAVLGFVLGLQCIYSTG